MDVSGLLRLGGFGRYVADGSGAKWRNWEQQGRLGVRLENATSWATEVYVEVKRLGEGDEDLTFPVES